MPGDRRGPVNPAVQAAAYDILPDVQRLLERAGRKHARTIQESLAPEFETARAQWSNDKAAGKVRHQSPYPVGDKVDQHTAATMIGLAVLDILPGEVLRVFAARADAASGPRGGSDVRRRIAFALGVTRQNIEMRLNVGQAGKRAGREGVTYGDLLKREVDNVSRKRGRGASG